MRRLTAWVGGIASGVVAYRFWRQHHGADTGAGPEAAAVTDARADELRTKLAESRAAEPAVEEPAEPAEPAAPEVEEAPAEAAEPESPAESPEERRRRVHAEGRAAIGEMDLEGPS